MMIKDYNRFIGKIISIWNKICKSMQRRIVRMCSSKELNIKDG